MRAFLVTDHKKPAKLQDIARPEPGPGQVQVKIAACGVNFADLLMAKGEYQDTPPLPFTLGIELAGTVTKLGRGVNQLTIGDRVAVYSGQGGMAEFGCFAVDQCIPLPASMSFDDAAAFQVAFGTSHLALHHRARLQPGETVLVLGAAGGVGLSAIRIAKLLGARVIAVARGAAKLKVAGDAGADHLINSEVDNIRDTVRTLGGADVVYDPVGGEAFTAALRACNPEARILTIGFASGQVPDIAANILLVKNLTVIGFYWGGYLKFNGAALHNSLTELFGWYEQGKLRPDISQRMPLEKASDALEMLRSRRSTGKIVIRPQPSSIGANTPAG